MFGRNTTVNIQQLARYHLSRGFRTSHVDKSVAFVFDIDGVLIRGARPLPQGAAALQLLNSKKIPWILLTNGGGKSEEDRVSDLADKLKVKISTQQIVQSHTPFKELADKYHRVLVVGGDGDRCRQVAQGYGFKDVVITADIVRADPNVWPFHRFQPAELASWSLERNLYDQASGESKIDAILVFNDPRDNGTDSQIVLDLLLSQHGYLGTRRDHLAEPQNSELEYPSIPIYFSNNDLLWANNYPIPRFGQGAFRIQVESLYKAMTHHDLKSTVIGKPFKYTYDYADVVLRTWASKIRSDWADHPSPVSRVIMVGDNPASDILGANNYGWDSYLVRTGVFRDEDLPSIVAKPTAIFDNVLQAVEHGINGDKQ